MAVFRRLWQHPGLFTCKFATGGQPTHPGCNQPGGDIASESAGEFDSIPA